VSDAESEAHRHADLLFWGLFGLALGLFVALLWVAPIPPLTDFGGHVQMAHAWRHAEDPGLIDLIVRRDAWWIPNVLLTRLVVILAPALGEIDALALLLSLAILATALGLVRLLAVMRRSRWLVFLALPLFWSGVFVLGLVNYVAALSLLPLALADALRLASAPPGARLAPAIRLALLGALAFFLHTFASLLIVGAVGMALLVTAPLRLFPLLLTPLIPTAALFLHWLLRVRTSMHELHTMTWPSLSEALAAIGIEFDVVSGPLDTACAATSAILAATLLLAPRRDRHDRSSSPVRTDRALPAVVVSLLLAYLFVLPEYVGDVFTGARVIAPMAWLAVLLPRPDVTRAVPRALLALGVLNALTAATAATYGVSRFSDAELAPLTPLIDRLPEGGRAQCVGVRPYLGFPRRPPLDHNCNGLLTARRGAFAGGGFANTDYNAVTLREKRPRLSDTNWTSAQSLADVDHVIVRATASTPLPDPRLATLIAVAPIADTPPAEWRLYARRPPPTLPSADLGPLAGGSGGAPFRWDCDTPPHRIDRVELASSRKGARLITGLSLACRNTPAPSPTFGSARDAAPRSLRCGSDEIPIGLEGRATTVVTALGLICRDVSPAPTGLIGLTGLRSALRGLSRATPRILEGSPTGAPFTLACPTGQTLVGLHGRAGVALDAVGIVCR
jgi:hypothetical protein